MINKLNKKGEIGKTAIFWALIIIILILVVIVAMLFWWENDDSSNDPKPEEILAYPNSNLSDAGVASEAGTSSGLAFLDIDGFTFEMLTDPSGPGGCNMLNIPGGDCDYRVARYRNDKDFIVAVVLETHPKGFNKDTFRDDLQDNAGKDSPEYQRADHDDHDYYAYQDQDTLDAVIVWYYEDTIVALSIPHYSGNEEEDDILETVLLGYLENYPSEIVHNG
ncbi:hypothetical protein GOV14_00205 [Candidatus Pacearchaeota archaeon]|nr:hypothetical protein [Candidatus Pacearchaeota archaeon]